MTNLIDTIPEYEPSKFSNEKRGLIEEKLKKFTTAFELEIEPIINDIVMEFPTMNDFKEYKIKTPGNASYLTGQIAQINEKYFTLIDEARSIFERIGGTKGKIEQDEKDELYNVIETFIEHKLERVKRLENEAEAALNREMNEHTGKDYRKEITKIEEEAYEAGLEPKRVDEMINRNSRR